MEAVKKAYNQHDTEDLQNKVEKAGIQAILHDAVFNGDSDCVKWLIKSRLFDFNFWREFYRENERMEYHTGNARWNEPEHFELRTHKAIESMIIHHIMWDDDIKLPQGDVDITSSSGDDDIDDNYSEQNS